MRFDLVRDPTPTLSTNRRIGLGWSLADVSFFGAPYSAVRTAIYRGISIHVFILFMSFSAILWVECCCILPSSLCLLYVRGLIRSIVVSMLVLALVQLLLVPSRFPPLQFHVCISY